MSQAYESLHADRSDCVAGNGATYGSGIYISGSNGVNAQSNFLLPAFIDCKISNNRYFELLTSDTQGGGVSIGGALAKPSFSGCNFTYNAAIRGAGVCVFSLIVARSVVLSVSCH